jgi:hypothetical protein
MARKRALQDVARKMERLPQHVAQRKEEALRVGRRFAAIDGDHLHQNLTLADTSSSDRQPSNVDTRFPRYAKGISAPAGSTVPVEYPVAIPSGLAVGVHVGNRVLPVEGPVLAPGHDDRRASRRAR